MTDIDSGTLEIGDAANPGAVLGGDVTVAANGMLRGHGTIGGNVVNDGEVFAGGSIGTLTVAGNYTQNSDGTLNVEITPSTVAGTGYDQLQVGGSASLAGALAVQVDNGTYNVGSLYDVLHAGGGVSGTFATTSYTPAFAAYITPVVTYSANDVTLELTPTQVAPNESLSDDLAFSSGRIDVASSFAQDAALFNILGAPFDATGENSTDRGYWLHGLGSFGYANGYDINEKGFVIGKGFDISPDLVIGGAVSNVYTGTTGGGSSADGTSFGALAYATYNAGPLTASASVTAGHLGTSISRALPSLGETGKAASNGAYEAAQLLLQYSLNEGQYFVAPYGTASYLHTSMGSAAETGAGILNLRYSSMSTSLAEFGAGLRAGLTLPVAYGTLTPWVQLGGEGTLGNTNVSNTETLGIFTAGETARAAPVGAFTPAVGVSLAGRSAWHLDAAWVGQYGSATSLENFTLQANYVW